MAKPMPEGYFQMVAKTFYGLEEVLPRNCATWAPCG